jgi:purine-binding chemotaxis protein CheW
MPASLPNNNGKAEILRARAKALAQEAIAEKGSEAQLEVIEFGLAQERYAVETTYVAEICPLDDLTPLPCAPPFIRGLVNVRGRILPVIDLKKFFDLPDQGITDLHRVLLIQTPEMTFGILADTVLGVRVIALEAIQSSLPTLAGIRAEYLRGVTVERLVILDVAKILNDRRIVVNETVEGQET